MDWILQNLQILATIGSALSVYYFLRSPISKIEQKLEDMSKQLNSLDSRVSRIEGQLTGIYHWEPRIHQIEEKK